MGAIAQISGVALVPGVSRNQRLYTPEIIQKAAERMQKRLADPNGLPIVMRTHHEAGDDSAKIVGRVTSVTVDNNKALRYKADLYNTPHGKTIANLVTPDSPALRSVSIHGYWMGETKQVTYQGRPATTADDLEIDAIDFTASPGVDGALIDKPTVTTENGILRTSISESASARVSVGEPVTSWTTIRGFQSDRIRRMAETYGWTPEEARAVPTGLLKGISVWEAKYSADDMKSLLSKGKAMKNASGEPSYPIADLSDLRKAIKAVGRGKASHDAIRQHIIKRAKALGAMDLIPANWTSSGSNETEYRLGIVSEYWPDGPANPSGFCIDAYSGPLSVTVRGSVSPDELRAAAKLAVCAAMDAICVMDPDDDADIDAFGDDSDMTTEDGGYMANADYGPDDDDKMGPKGEAKPVNGVAPGKRGAIEADAVDGINRNKASKKAIRKAVQKEMAKMMRDKAKPSDDDGDESAPKTSPSATKESTPENTKESAVSETTAASAAPNRALTDEDMKVLGETIGSALADAIRAVAETQAPKHAATPTQETTETPAESVAAVESNTKTEPSIAEMKESLAKELRNELRAELLKENGLPPRRGYRVNEESDEQVEMTDAELYDKHRVDILLGAFAAKTADAPAN